VQLMLWGNLQQSPTGTVLECLAAAHLPATGFDADVTLDHGRIIVKNPKNAPAVLRLRYRGEVWGITLGASAELLLDGLVHMAPGQRFSKEGAGESPLTELHLGVLKGKVTVQRNEAAPVELTAAPGPALLSWDNRSRPKEPTRIREALPQWSMEAPTHSPAKEQAAELKSLIDDLKKRLARPNASIEVVLAELAQGGKPIAHAYTPYALAATGQVGPLVDWLDDLLNPALRGNSFMALRHWIAQHRDNAGELYRLLLEKKDYTEPQADAVLQLMHEFSMQDSLAPATYGFLFEQLNDPKLPVRELAYWHLERLDPEGAKEARYNPTSPERAAMIARWRKRLTDGKLPPKPPKPASGPEKEPAKKP